MIIKAVLQGGKTNNRNIELQSTSIILHHKNTDMDRSI